MSDNGKDDFNRLRAQFARLANAPELPALASKLCWVIAFGRMDLKRRSTFVSQITLASDLGGVTVRSVQRMIDVLKPLGLKVAPGHGPNRASTYWIGEANTTSMSPIQSGQGDTGVGSTRHTGHLNTTPVSPLLKKVSKKVSKGQDAEGGVSHTSRADRESATADDASPNQRAAEAALIEPVDMQKQASPERDATELGTAANATHGFDARRRAAFATIRDDWQPERIDEAEAYEAFCDAVAVRGLTAVVAEVRKLTLETDAGDLPLLSDALDVIGRDP